MLKYWLHACEVMFQILPKSSGNHFFKLELLTGDIFSYFLHLGETYSWPISILTSMLECLEARKIRYTRQTSNYYDSRKYYPRFSFHKFSTRLYSASYIRLWQLEWNFEHKQSTFKISWFRPKIDRHQIAEGYCRKVQLNIVESKRGYKDL